MPSLNVPLQLSSVFKPKIWGRADLAPIFKRSKNQAKNAADKLDEIGEVWLTDDESKFMNGPIAGMTLAEASRRFGRSLNGSRWKGVRFPILAKYLFTSDWLSIQVHPDDVYARAREPGSPGKCEMWYFIQSEKHAEVMLGLKQGATSESLRAALVAGKVSELMERFHPRQREAALILPGIIHALGPGLVLFEAEQNSDLTYRLDDFGRMGLDGKPRPLHLEKGLEVARAEATALRNLPSVEFREPFGRRRYLVACRHFAVEELTLEGAAAWRGSPERVEIYSVLQGSGRVETAAGWMGYRAGDTWLIPPATPHFRFVPKWKTQLIKFYVPDVEKDFVEPLLKRRVPHRKIDAICFQ